MLCQYCKSEAKFICQCLGKLCEDHIRTHSKTCKKFNIKIIEDENNLKLYPIDLIKRITKIDEINYEILRKTEEIILKIKNRIINQI